MKLSILIPCFNEAATVAETIARIQRVPLADPSGNPIEKELIVVDDASTDATPAILAALAAADAARAGDSHAAATLRVIRHEHNRGKGAALRTALAAATGDILIIQDADLEYHPAEYPLVLEPIIAGRADVVFGSRFVGGQSHRVLYFWHSVANRLLTLCSNCITNLNLTDMMTCTKAFRREVLRGEWKRDDGPARPPLTIQEDRFGVEAELTAKVARAKWRVYEVGVSYSGRTYEEGKKITWRDGLNALLCIVKYA